MSEAAYRDCLRLAKHLSAEEVGLLREYLTSLASLHQAGGAAPAANVPMGTDLAGIVAEVLEGLGMGRVGIAQMQGSVPRYTEVSAQLWAFARTAMPEGKRVDHLSILRLGVRMLVKNIEAQGIPITHAIVMRQLIRLPAVVDHGFPGWARNGFLGVIVRSKRSGK